MPKLADFTVWAKAQGCEHLGGTDGLPAYLKRGGFPVSLRAYTPNDHVTAALVEFWCDKLSLSFEGFKTHCHKSGIVLDPDTERSHFKNGGPDGLQIDPPTT